MLPFHKNRNVFCMCLMGVIMRCKLSIMDNISWDTGLVEVKQKCERVKRRKTPSEVSKCVPADCFCFSAPKELRFVSVHGANINSASISPHPSE